MMQETDNQKSIKQIVEALLFAANTPLSTRKLLNLLNEELQLDRKELLSAINSLKEDYQTQGHSFEIKELAGGFILQTLPEYEKFLQKLYPAKAVKLSASSLEVLAIIAYKQPITRIEIEHIRGVDCQYALSQLLERLLVTNQKKAEAPGQPSLFETTDSFLEHFGLKNLKDLPELKSDSSTTSSEQQSLPDLAPHAE